MLRLLTSKTTERVADSANGMMMLENTNMMVLIMICSEKRTGTILMMTDGLTAQREEMELSTAEVNSEKSDIAEEDSMELSTVPMMTDLTKNSLTFKKNPIKTGIQHPLNAQRMLLVNCSVKTVMDGEQDATRTPTIELDAWTLKVMVSSAE